MAKRINFKSDVSSELRAYLQKEYNEYTAKTSMTEDEHKALRKWIEEGNSPYSNPALYADERGVEMTATLDLTMKNAFGLCRR